MNQPVIDFGAWRANGSTKRFEQTEFQVQQDQAALRLAESVYSTPPTPPGKAIPYPSEPPITGRSHYGQIAPIALDALTPGVAKGGQSAGVSEYIDYMDYAIVNNRTLNAELYSRLTNAIQQKATSHAGFQKLVRESVSPDAKDAAPLIHAYQDFCNAHRNDTNPTIRLHTTAALETGLACYILEKGTVIQPTKSDADGRIMAGTKLDLGAHAAGYLFSADKNLYDLQNYLKQNNLSGSQDVQQSRDFVQHKLQEIFGPHDIPAGIQSLKQAYRLNISEMAHFQVDLVRRVRALPVSSPAELKIAAKGCRDVAILDIAIAQYKAERGDGEGAEILWKEANQFLNAAKQLDNGNADMPELQKASDKTNTLVKEAIKRQYGNWFNNPFGVERR